MHLCIRPSTLPNKSQVHASLAVFQNEGDGVDGASGTGTGTRQWRTETEASKKKLRLQNGNGAGGRRQNQDPRTTKWQNMNKNFVRSAAADKLKLMTILL